MGLCLGAQINKQDISKPQEETAGSRGLLTKHRVSLQGAEGPVPTGSQVTELVGDPSWGAARINPLSCAAEQQEPPVSPQCPSSATAAVTHRARGRAGALRELSQAAPELRGREQHPLFFRAQRCLENVLLKHSCSKGNRKGRAVQPKCSRPALLGGTDSARRALV